MAESEEELKGFLMKMKEDSKKVDLKLNIQKTEIMASGPITSWQIDGEAVENSERLSFYGLQNHYRLWLQPWNLKTVAPWKKSMTTLDSILKGRDMTLPTKVHVIKAMIFPVVMYGCESWIINKVEHWGIDDFELWC